MWAWIRRNLKIGPRNIFSEGDKALFLSSYCPWCGGNVVVTPADLRIVGDTYRVKLQCTRSTCGWQLYP